MSNNLQLKRKSVGLTQSQLAKLAGITERGYRCYEASEKAKRKSIPDVLTAIKIANALEVKDLRELWGDNSSQSPTFQNLSDLRLIRPTK